MTRAGAVLNEDGVLGPAYRMREAGMRARADHLELNLRQMVVGILDDVAPRALIDLARLSLVCREGDRRM